MHTNFADALTFVLAALFFLILVITIGRQLHKEAFPTVVFALLGYMAFNIALWRIFNSLPIFSYIGLVISTLLLLFLAYFFRKPPAALSNKPKDLLAPAYGRIVNIENTSHSLLEKDATLISIFMSPFNIHANFMPAGGTIKFWSHNPGDYLMAFHPKSSEKNEHTQILVETDFGQIVLKQIAGFLARRIVTYIKEGSEVEQGNEFGFIKFGSRLDIYIPRHFDILVNEGDQVKGGLTILASLKE